MKKWVDFSQKERFYTSPFVFSLFLSLLYSFSLCREGLLTQEKGTAPLRGKKKKYA